MHRMSTPSLIYVDSCHCYPAHSPSCDYNQLPTQHNRTVEIKANMQQYQYRILLTQITSKRTPQLQHSCLYNTLSAHASSQKKESVNTSILDRAQDYGTALHPLNAINIALSYLSLAAPNNNCSYMRLVTITHHNHVTIQVHVLGWSKLTRNLVPINNTGTVHTKR